MNLYFKINYFFLQENYTLILANRGWIIIEGESDFLKLIFHQIQQYNLVKISALANFMIFQNRAGLWKLIPHASLAKSSVVVIASQLNVAVIVDWMWTSGTCSERFWEQQQRR